MKKTDNDKAAGQWWTATTLYGLEEVLAQELTALGARDVRPLHRAVEFTGDKQLMYRANLWCRTAIRILRPIKSFRTADEDELYKRIGSINWSRYMDADQTIAIDAILNRSKLTNANFVAVKAKDAIADQFREREGVRPSVDRDNPDIRINLFIDKDVAVVSLDCSGGPLQRRGYRTDAGEAPLSEVLAAGIILLTGWDRKSPFIDGMCGSGTFVIEAAMMARNIAPGLLREKFGFQAFKDFAPAQYEKTRNEAAQAALQSLPFEVVGSDINGDDLKVAQANAARAGVADDIRFEQKDFVQQTPPAEAGVLVINPPYGERLQGGKKSAINDLYSSIGDSLKKRFEGYDAWVLTSNIEAAKHIGLRASRKIKLYNGPLECRLFRYSMYHGSRKAKKSGGRG